MVQSIHQTHKSKHSLDIQKFRAGECKIEIDGKSMWLFFDEGPLKSWRDTAIDSVREGWKVMMLLWKVHLNVENLQEDTWS